MPSREDLLGYLLGALDAQEQAQVESHLCNHAEIETQLHELKACMSSLSVPADLTECPPGLARRTCEHVSRYVRDPSLRTPLRQQANESHSDNRALRPRHLALMVGLSLIVPSIVTPWIASARLAVPASQVVAERESNLPMEQISPASRSLAGTLGHWPEPQPLMPLSEDPQNIQYETAYLPGSLARSTPGYSPIQSVLDSGMVNPSTVRPTPEQSFNGWEVASDSNRSNPSLWRPVFSETTYRIPSFSRADFQNDGRDPLTLPIRNISFPGGFDVSRNRLWPDSPRGPGGNTVAIHSLSCVTLLNQSPIRFQAFPAAEPPYQ